MSRLRPYWPFLALGLLALPAAWPFFQPDALPRTNDALTHLYRAIQLDRLLPAGVWLPRWAPDLVFGYGYPVFNYFPYLAHLLIVAGHRLGLDFLAAYQAAGALTLILSAWTAYALAQELFGEAAGLLAGAAYVYSPYLLYDAHIRGSLPESLALALLPLALLYLRRAARGDARAAWWAGLALAGCLFSHHGVTLQAMPFVLAYGAFEVWQGARLRRAGRPAPSAFIWRWACPPWVLAMLPFGLALGLTAFFWLPALLESGLVQIERGTQNGGMLYSANFLSLAELTAQLRAPVDPDLLNPPVARPLPLAALLLAALALMRWLPRPSAQRTQLLFWAGAIVAGVALIHPLSRPLWDAVPLLRLTLFPWRLLGPLALFSALAAGALFCPWDEGARVSSSSRPSLEWPVSLAALGLVLTGLPFASPPYEPVPARPGLADLAAFELPPDFIGTTTVGEYLPRAVQQLPADAAARRSPEARPRFSAPGAAVEWQAVTPYHDQFAIDAPAPITFIYQQFYFPGWRAVLDGAPAEVRVTAPDGLMAVDVPAGAHTLTFTFGDTGPRTAGQALSLLTLAVFGLGLLVAGPRVLAEPVGRPARPPWPVLGLALALVLARPLAWDSGRTPFLRRGLQADGLRGVAHPVGQSFSGELTLLGWEAPRLSASADEPLRVDLFWRAEHPLGVPYAFEVTLVDEQGFTWSERDPGRPRDWRFTPGTDFWPVDQYVLDPYLLQPLAGAPPGRYQVQVTGFSRYDFRVIGSAMVGPFTLTAPARRPCGAADVGLPGLRLAEFGAESAAPGDERTVTLCWQGAPAEARLRLLDAAGRDRLDAEAIRARSATPGADTAASVRQQVRVLLPAGLETGRYTWAVEAAGARAPFTALEITAPARTFTAPALQANGDQGRRGQVLQAGLGPVALYAVAAPAALTPGAPLPVTLIWQSVDVVRAAYHVFVHLIGPDGVVYAQSDGGPAGWTRPVTGWLPGEYIVDERRLDVPAELPAGTYTLYAGLYRPADGVRLTSPAFPEGRVKLAELAAP
ncbi:MAG: glycosyltransferase family 39 protein [Anaerolineales bacterium]|nr:glycosyltransferase family 39 protein [Anaerolineales bacterium]